jgi:structural maintenance of chromosome 4
MFVLGYRAKKLRQGKLSELIHNSEGMMNLESCTVEVHFRIISGVEEREEAQKLVVSRTAYRNSSNKYLINGHTSSYSDVQSLLKGYGVDLDHKRFLILQVSFQESFAYLIHLFRAKSSQLHK